MPRFKVVNGKSIQLTAEEEAEIITEQTRMTNELQATIDAETASNANKASGKQKLKDLGLNDDEIKALTGA